MKLKLYHGSNLIVKNVSIIKSSRFLDFGSGFYTTSNLEQATSWSKRVCYRNKEEKGFVSVYNFDLDNAEKKLTIKRFSLEATQEWLDFVVKCRNGNEPSEDILIGPVADDNVYSVIKNFETGIYDAEYALKLLQTQKLKDQYLFHTERSLEFLKFETSQEIVVDE